MNRFGAEAERSVNEPSPGFGSDNQAPRPIGARNDRRSRHRPEAQPADRAGSRPARRRHARPREVAPTRSSSNSTGRPVADIRPNQVLADALGQQITEQNRPLLVRHDRAGRIDSRSAPMAPTVPRQAATGFPPRTAASNSH